MPNVLFISKTFLPSKTVELHTQKGIPWHPMDEPTKKYYATRAAQISRLYNQGEGGVSAHFTEAFPEGSRVLEIGAGSGRDLRLLLEAGYNACGIDASEEMVAHATGEYPELKERYVAGEVPSSTLFFGGEFDGILCAAVLMHLPDDQVYQAAVSIGENLKQGGTLLLSVPLERPDIDETNRSRDGRLFVLRPSEYYEELFEKIGFTCMRTIREEDGLGRAGYRWLTMIFAKD